MRGFRTTLFRLNSYPTYFNFPWVAPFGNCSRVARAMTCLRAWRSEVPREIWRFPTAGSPDGRCEWFANVPPRAVLHMGEVRVYAKQQGCATRRKVVGLRRTCAGLSCLTLDVFLGGVPGCIDIVCR